MHLADPNPVLFVIAAVVGIVTVTLAVLYVREVTANGKAAAAAAMAPTPHSASLATGPRRRTEKGVVR